jgi:hypothetical protein
MMVYVNHEFDLGFGEFGAKFLAWFFQRKLDSLEDDDFVSMRSIEEKYW